VSTAAAGCASYAIGGGGSWARLRELGAKPLILKPQFGCLFRPFVSELQRAALGVLKAIDLGAELFVPLLKLAARCRRMRGHHRKSRIG
jgi:hypothetical protein